MPRRRSQGPIRTGAIIPFTIVAVLTWGYTHFFFDGHLRRALEYAGTRANGAEVNFGRVETSFWNASVDLRDIQVTDAREPARNLVRIGRVDFRMLWDGLLRGKVVVDTAEVLDIQVLSPREKPGRVLPVDPDAQGLTDRLLANAKSEFSGNVLGDLVAILDGADPASQLGKIRDDLKSSARIASLQRDLVTKEAEWKARIAGLPKSEEFTALEQRLRQVKFDRFKDVQEVQTSLKELEAIRTTVKGHVDNVNGTSQALGQEVKAYKTLYAELEQAIKQDVADLQAHFRIPTLDAKTFANVLFGPDLLAKVAEAHGYMEKARAYMPPKRSAEEQAARQLLPHERAEGRNYAFGRPNAYPRFWLKHAAISSKSGSGPYAGDLQGEIRDVTTDAPLVGRPMVLTVQGDFPAQSIHDTRFELAIDHVTENPVERISAFVGRYGVSGRSLVKSPEVDLGFDKAAASSLFTAELSGEKVDLRFTSNFTDVGYLVRATSPVAQELITAALGGVSGVNLDAEVSGTWSALDWYLASNLGTELEKGFRRHLAAKVDEAKARIQAMVNERIAAERAKLQAQFAAAEAAVAAQLAAKQAEVDKLRAQLDEAKSRIEAQKTAFVKAQEDKLKKGVDQFLQDAVKRK